MRRKIIFDSSGVEAIPMKLLVVVLVLAIIIPSFLVGLISWSNSQAESNLESEINKIETTLKQTYEADPGTSFTMNVDLQDGMTKNIDYVKCGDMIGEHGGPYQSMIRSKFHDEGVKFRTIVDPNIMNAQPDNTALELGTGKKNIISEKHMIGDTGFVIVRFPDDDGEFKMADCSIYEEDIKLEKGGFDDEGRIYKTINITVRNIGNLDTVLSPWPLENGTGEVMVTAYDKLIMTGEVRELRTFDDVKVENYSVGPIEEDGSFDIKIQWYPVGPDDDPQNTSLLKREIIVYVDTHDNVDEITRYNNMGSRLFINEPPFINYVAARYDEDLPGLGSYITGIECKNEIYANATDPDGEVMRTYFWYSNYEGKDDRFYPEDKFEPSAFDDIPPDAGYNFRTDLDMANFSQSTIFTTKAYDDWGCGGDPYNTTIWMEKKPQWMEGLSGKYSSYLYDYDSESYQLEVIIPKALFEEYGFDYIYPGIPFLTNTGDFLDDPGYIRLIYPFDGEAKLLSENDLDIQPFGIDMEILGYNTVTLDIGKDASEVDESTALDIKDLKDLFNNAILIGSYKESYLDMLEHDFSEIVWEDLFEPSEEAFNSSVDFGSYLGTISSELNGNDIYIPVKDSIDLAKEIFEKYPASFDEIWDLWQEYLTTLDHQSWLNSLTIRGVGGTTYDVYLGHFNLIKIIEEVTGIKNLGKWEIFPPILWAELIAVLEIRAGGFVEVAFYGDHDSGLEIEGFEVGLSPQVILKVGMAITAGIDLDFLTAGIRAVIQGAFGANPQASVGYSSIDGFYARIGLALEIVLQYFIEAFIDLNFGFFTYTISWKLFEGDFPLWDGYWEKKLEAHSPIEETENMTYTNGSTENFTEPYKGPANVSIPRGPIITVDSDGNVLYVKSEDVEINLTQLPDYEIMYSWDGTDWEQITNNSKMETEPLAIFNSTGTPFIFWTQCGDNKDLIEINGNITDIVKDSDLYYSRYENGNWTTPAQLTSDPGSDMGSSVIAGYDGTVMIIWTRDLDNNVSTGGDKKVFFRVWDGSAWTVEQEKPMGAGLNSLVDTVALKDGRMISVWVNDNDENTYTLSDQQIKYAIFEGGSWGQPTSLTYDNSKKDSMTLGCNGDQLVAVWVQREKKGEVMGNWTLWSSTFDPILNTWSALELIHDTPSMFPMVHPLVDITDDGMAILTWRGGFELINWSKAEGGYIYVATKDLVDKTQWTEPRKLAVSHTLFDYYSTQAIGPDGRLIYLYRLYQSTIEGEHRRDHLNTVYYTLQPDLTVSSVLVDGENNLTAMQDDTVIVEATITNLGDLPAENVQVEFYDGDPDSGGQLLGSDTLDVTRLTDPITTVSWQVEKGVHEIYVVVDSSETIAEHNETNNRAFCTINSLPDLEIEASDISFSSGEPNAGDVVQITAKVENIGDASSDNLKVSFYDGDPFYGGLLIQSQTVISLGINQMDNITINWTALTGIHEIYVELVEIIDGNQTNNMAYNTIRILPDLFLGEQDMIIEEPIIFQGQSAFISADVHNIGGGNADNVVVKFYTKDTYIGYDVISVSSGATATASLSWQAPTGTYIIYAMVDPGNQIMELNENNNLMSLTLSSLEEMDLTVDLDLDASSKGKVLITAEVRNEGNSDATLVSVEIFHGDPEESGILISSRTFDIFSKNSTKVVTFDWETTSGTKIIFVVIDGGDINPESDETNNIKSKSIEVKGEKIEEGSPWPILIVVIILIAVPAAIIIYYWRKKLA